jgi:acyl-CoA ligase (AMP-forming) (exosortase A-associated)
MQLSNIAGPIKWRAENCGDAAALIYEHRVLSFSQLWHEIERFGLLLSQIGIRPGERVGVFLENRPEAVAAWVGAAAIGAIAVPMNWMLKAPQVRHILTHCAASCLISSAARLRMLAPTLAEVLPALHIVAVDEVPSEIRAQGRTHVAAASAPGGSALAEFAPTIDEDPAVILYTSGSTGLPKGVLLSHRNILTGAFAVASYLRMGPDDRVLCAIPLGFDAGLNQVTSTLFAGGTAVLHSYTRALEAVRCCVAAEVTGATGVPPFWLDLAAHDWPDAARQRLRYFATTGGPMPRPLLQDLRRLFPQAAPYLMYGLTEAYRSTYLEPALVDERPGSIGKSIPNARVSVVRRDGTPCAPRELGELVHVGGTVAIGYWNDPPATAERFRPIEVEAGGLRRSLPAVWSGDLAWQDDDGFIYFVGRNDAMIKTAGFRVSPTEVEDLVLASGVAREAVALGLPDTQRGQVIGICLGAPTDGLDEASLRKALLRHFRIEAPSYMAPEAVLIVDRLPRTPTGKFDRERCSEMLHAMPGERRDPAATDALGGGFERRR